ncbi:protein bfr2 [Colletotrichum spaethianum]|uniref:Protein BFR2 n=1 Tax=Colletotrichum spaethianum TaxID=700344 RepID=A0AA37UK83_9PEZI|nr:protein bfr2 [Colletotrichum spaethianum]GKT49636.1 protein bfr2 [Colletotrichum spaethianum]
MATRRRASDWEEKAPKDLDPEAEPVEESENESGSEESVDENAGTEHYVTVGKSKLREKEGVSLGPQYRGARVSRDALNDSSNEDDSDVFEDAQEDIDSSGEEFDDPETADLAADEAAAGGEDLEISSDDALGDSDDEKLDGFVLAATISAAAQQDAQKGLAVREQRKTFDGLLNIRIRLQKALVATNSFSAVESPSEEDEQNSEPYEAAEEAALKLLNTLDSFRASLLPAELAQQAAGAKRKRGDYDASTSNEAIWEGIQEAEQRAAKYRKKVLETWSTKTRSANVEVKSRNLISTQTSIVASLEDQLLSADRLIKRTRTPRSCAPAQVARKVNEDPEIYDDADFYQLLLKELVEQRTSDAGNGTAAQPTVRWAAMKEAKTKKHVDRRASKGRKMRFNVHEKLQNFMAPEDRRAWEQDAIDRLFGTLFGQKMELSEQASDAEMEDDDEVDAEEAGLRLFRN